MQLNAGLDLAELLYLAALKIPTMTKKWADNNRVKKCIVPMIAVVVPPGAPTVDKAGPLLPTLDTNISPCLFTASEIISQIRL